MSKGQDRNKYDKLDLSTRIVILGLIFTLVCPFNIFSATDSPQRPQLPRKPIKIEEPDNTTPKDPVQAEPDLSEFPDSMWLTVPRHQRVEVVGDSVEFTGDSLKVTQIAVVPVETDTTAAATNPDDEFDPDYVVRDFNPDPTRAVWMSALFPGLGQLYNRRYWKLPIVIGGFMGLGYATSWNNRMLNDYTQAYRDLMDNDPSTKSYMDFFPPNAKEEDLNRSWMERTFKARKDFYRRNRDLCIICMVGVYLIAMVDAYVDASLSHFDISPDLTMDVYPTLIPDTRNSRVGIGLQWALNF